MADDPHDFESLLERMAPGAGSARDGNAPARGGGDEVDRSTEKTREMAAPEPPNSAISVRVPVSTAGVSALPPEEARERLSWITLQASATCLIIYGLWALNYPPAYLTEVRPELDLPRVFPLEHVAAWVCVGLSLVVFLLARGRKLPAVWVTDLGLLYYAVMEYLDGLDLDRLVREHGPIPPARAVFFLVQACDSLAEAHAQGLLHRDIKPGNLIVCRYGLAFDFPKLLDFGLVLACDAADEDSERLTSLGVVPGTPACVAPEVVGGVSDLDHRVDLYGLGCVAYWLLTGRKVFEAPNARAMMMEHATTQPTPPSQQAEQAIPAALDRLVLDCLAKRPGDRPADSLELKRRLQEVEIDEVWTEEFAREWWEAR